MKFKQQKTHFEKTFRSSFHFSISFMNKQGKPHVSPIGSLFLRDQKSAFFFEHFATQFEEGQAVCLLAVDSGFWFWCKSLLSGKLKKPPALRFQGRLGKKRKATSQEIQLWQKRIGVFRFFKGYKLLWRDMTIVREIHIENEVPVRLGQMTQAFWQN